MHFQPDNCTVARINFAGIVDGVSNGVTRPVGSSAEFPEDSRGPPSRTISTRGISRQRTAACQWFRCLPLRRETSNLEFRRFSRWNEAETSWGEILARNEGEGDGVYTYERGRVERFESTPLNRQRAQHASRARSGRLSTRKIDKVRELWRCLGLTDNNGSN